MQAYFDADMDWDTLKVAAPQVAKGAGGYNPERCRSKALTLETYEATRIQQYALYPFDSRWCYYTQAPALWNRPRPELAAQRWEGNSFLITRMFAERPSEGVPFMVTCFLPDYHLLRPNAVAIPLRVRNSSTSGKDDRQSKLMNASAEAGEPPKANLSSAARAYLAGLRIDDPDADAEKAGMIWMHALAIGYSPAYLTENADGIRQDWPRLPLPDSKELLFASAELGKQVAVLLDTERDVRAVREPPLQHIAVFTLPRGTPLKEAEHFAITAGWGHAGKGGVTMPGKGKIIERDYSPAGREAFVGPRGERCSPLLGDRTCDVYLNDVAYWSNIPARVWEYTIGGYQVIKKWLSYREQKLLGRPLTKGEVRYVQEMARRIAAIVLLEPELDENYRSVKAHCYPWPTKT
jgi:hypothetical protein